jgi:hypothetical protein
VLLEAYRVGPHRGELLHQLVDLKPQLVRRHRQQQGAKGRGWR